MNSDKLRRAGIRLTEVHEAIERDLRNWTKIGSAEPSSSERRSPQPNARSTHYSARIRAMLRHRSKNPQIWLAQSTQRF